MIPKRNKYRMEAERREVIHRKRLKSISKNYSINNANEIRNKKERLKNIIPLRN